MERKKTPRWIAAMAGERFYDGSVCSLVKRHGTLRYTSIGTCVACTREKAAASRAKMQKIIRKGKR